jgi:glycogen(starch) synthase
MGSNLKLLMTTDVSGEVWDYTHALCKTLSASGAAKILVLACGGMPSKEQREQLQNSNYDIVFLEYSFNWRNGFDIFQQNINKIETIVNNSIQEFSPDLIHWNNSFCTLKNDLPQIHAVHEDVLGQIYSQKKHGGISESDYKKYRDIIISSLDMSGVIVATSRFLADEILKKYEINKKIKIIYNGISFESNSEFANEPFLITKLSAQNSYHNLIFLIKTAQKMPENIKIFVLGEKPAGNFKKPKNIEFLSGLSGEELKEFYKKSSIYLALSSWDVYSRTQIEAAYSNCAIVANDVPIFRDLWGDCACIFDRNNVNSLIKNINNLIENSRLLNLTAKNCQAKALSVFNSKRMCYEYANLYRDVAQRITKPKQTVFQKMHRL